MKKYVLLLRGINVGGKNKIPMTELKSCLEQLGCTEVKTYIQSGNAIVSSALDAQSLERAVENQLTQSFTLDSSIVKVLALTHRQLADIVGNKPKGFGAHPDIYHSDVIFLMGITEKEAMAVFDPREGVDQVWHGKGVIYSQRLSAERTKSRLNKIVGTQPYQSMTIRNWNTTTKLLELMAPTN